MGSSSKTTEQVMKENAAVEAAALASPPHASVAHVKVCALRYLEAAEASLENGCPILALHQVSVAQGIGEALAAVTAKEIGTPACREGAIRVKINRRAAEIRMMVTRLFPERGKE